MSEKNKKSRNKVFETNLAALINIIVIVVILISGAVYILLMPHEKVAQDENRVLTEMPKFTLKKYFKGDFTGGIADHFDDTIHNRTKIKKFIASTITPLKGRKYGDENEGAELYGTPVKTPKPITVTTKPPQSNRFTTTLSLAEGQTEPTVVTTKPPVSAEEPAAEGGEISNSILVVNKRGIPLYGGGLGREREYAAFVDEYKTQLPNVNVWSMVIPTPCSMYLPSNYKSLSADEKIDIFSISDALQKAVPVDVYHALLNHKSEEIYARTDHHWLALGAFYAAQEFANLAHLPFNSLSAYEELHLHDYLGTYYSYTQSSSLLDNPEEFIYYKPKNEVTVTQYDTSFNDPTDVALLVPPDNLTPSGYYYVFGMDNRIAHVHTNVKNGRRLIIFKDSYGNALLPFLTYSFEDIYLCDIRYFDLNAASFAQQVDATDILFAMCTFSAVGDNRLCIRNNLYK